MSGIKLKDPRIKQFLPNIGDRIVKDIGEVKENFVVVKKYNTFVLGIGDRTNTRECFSLISLVLGEYPIRKAKSTKKGLNINEK